LLTGGNHHPLLALLEDESGPAGTWVIKPQHVTSMSDPRGPLSVLAELASAEVCSWAAIPTPAIALARFPPTAIADQIRRSVAHLPKPEQDEIVQIYEINRGQLAFCSRFLPDAVNVERGTFRSIRRRACLEETGVALFFVDAYLVHDDRRIENPNVMWHRDRLVAIDHGAAFAGLLRNPGMTGARPRQADGHRGSTSVRSACPATTADEDPRVSGSAQAGSEGPRSRPGP